MSDDIRAVIRDEIRLAMGEALRDVIKGFSREADLRNPARVLRLAIDGIEVTQAIQYRQASEHLTDPADRGRDNGTSLVADKPALVRVYVRSGFTPIHGVMASVMLQRLRHGVWRDTFTLAPTGWPTLTAEPAPAYAAERSDLRASLNFLIPAALMRGHGRLRVHVEVPGDPQLAHDADAEINALLKQTLRIRGIPVQYWGPDAAGAPVTLAAPRLADFQRTAGVTLRMYPVSQTPDITVAGLCTISAPLTGNMAGGVCPTSWIDLLAWLAAAKFYDGNDPTRLYYGLLPSGIPIGDTTGCGGSGSTGSGFIDDGPAMAHELGHMLGLAHAPGCLPADDNRFDAAYPAYEPYDTVANRMASIGEYGTDVTRSTVYSPQFTADFMSYCPGPWISLYHYHKLLGHPSLDPQRVSDPQSEVPSYLDDRVHHPRDIPDPLPPWVGRRMYRQLRHEQAPLIVLSGFVTDGVVEIRRVIRVPTGTTPSGRTLEGVVAELRGANQELLGRAPVRWIAPRACGCGGCSGGCDDARPTGIVEAFLPDTGQGTELRLVREGDTIWSRTAPANPPTVSAPIMETAGDQLMVRWTTQASDEFGVERVLRWSADEGRSWQLLALGPPEDEAVVPLAQLPPGTVLVQALVSDGFHGVAGDAAAVDVPRRPPQVAILWPTEGATVRTDARVRLWGAATAADGHPLPREALRWELDGEPVGDGPEAWAEVGAWEGEHRATLRATDGDQQASASVIFLATCSGRRPHILSRG